MWRFLRIAVPIITFVIIIVVIWRKEKAAVPLPPAKPTSEHIAAVEAKAADDNRKSAEKKAADEKRKAEGQKMAAEKKEAKAEKKAADDRRAAEKKEREDARLAAKMAADAKPKAVKTVRYIVFHETQLPIEGSPKAGESFMERRQRLVTDAVGKTGIPDSSKIVAVEGGYAVDGHGVGGEYTLIAYELETIPAAESHRIPRDRIVPDGYSDGAVADMAKALWEKQQDRSVVHTVTAHHTQNMSNGRYTTRSNSTHSISATYKTRR